MPAGASGVLLLDPDGVAGEETRRLVRGLHIGSAVFPKRKPNTKDNDVAGQQRAKENHDKNHCAARHEAIATDVGSTFVKTNYMLSRKKILSRTADLACQTVTVQMGCLIGGAIHESIPLYLCFADVDRATDRLGG